MVSLIEVAATVAATHVVATAALLQDQRFRGRVAKQPYWLLGGATLAGLACQLPVAPLLAAWQSWHFGSQNLGVAKPKGRVQRVALNVARCAGLLTPFIGGTEYGVALAVFVILLARSVPCIVGVTLTVAPLVDPVAGLTVLTLEHGIRYLTLIGQRVSWWALMLACAVGFLVWRTEYAPVMNGLTFAHFWLDTFIWKREARVDAV